jgi:hypothetical protein
MNHGIVLAVDESSMTVTLCTATEIFRNSTRILEVAICSNRITTWICVQLSFHFSLSLFSIPQKWHCFTTREGRGFGYRWVILSFFIYNSCGRTVVLGSTQPVKEMSTRVLVWRVKAAGAWGWKNLPPLYPNCVRILGASTSCSSKGLCRPVQEELYLYPQKNKHVMIIIIIIIITNIIIQWKRDLLE